VEIADWNRDGRPDIVALGEGPRLSNSPGESGGGSFGVVIYLNQGDGTWKRVDEGVGGGQNHGDTLVTGDFNGDGRVDFAAGTNIMGRNDLVSLQQPDGGWTAEVVSGLRPNAYVRSVAAADFDRDGRTDLVVGLVGKEGTVWRSVLDVFLARLDGTWIRRPLYVEETREGVTAVAVGDLDGDAAADVVALTGDGKTAVFLGNNRGEFVRQVDGIPAFAGACRGYGLRLADLDHDGKAEIVAGFAGESSALFAPDVCTSGGGLVAWAPVADAGRRSR
jgi:hypothetical protein